MEDLVDLETSNRLNFKKDEAEAQDSSRSPTLILDYSENDLNMLFKKSDTFNQDHSGTGVSKTGKGFELSHNLNESSNVSNSP